MSGFYSKELNRTFKEIQFVGQIQKVDWIGLNCPVDTNVIRQAG
jgi:hypothetical protein